MLLYISPQYGRRFQHQPRGCFSINFGSISTLGRIGVTAGGAAIGFAIDKLSGGNGWTGAAIGGGIALGATFIEPFEIGKQFDNVINNVPLIVNSCKAIDNIIDNPQYTPAPYSNDYLNNLFQLNFPDIPGVKWMKMDEYPSNYEKMSNGNIRKKGSHEDEAVAVTVRRNFDKNNPNTSYIYFAKNAFSSKEYLAEVMVHELGHVIFNYENLYDLAGEKTSDDLHELKYLDDEGHIAIYTVEKKKF